MEQLEKTNPELIKEHNEVLKVLMNNYDQQIKNIEQIKFTGKKFQEKKYYRHTGHPGGIKETTPEKLSKKKPGEALKLAVKRMLPGGVLGRKQLTKLKIYSGSDHPHTAQNPQVIELGKLNSKNLART